MLQWLCVHLILTEFYMGSQFLHQSDDMGNSWKIISPDLTTNDPAKQDQDNSGGLSMGQFRC